MVGHRRKSMSPLTMASIAVFATVAVIVVVALGFFLAGWLPFGVVVGSGNLRTQEENLTGFAIVNVGSGFKVQVTHASSYEILITADDNVLEYVQVAKTGNTLSIGLQPGLSFRITTLRAEITMPDLREVQFSGGTNGTASGFVLSHDFRVDLSGGSVLKMDGQAEDVTAVCSGGSTLDLSDFLVDDAEIDFSGGSQGTVNLSGTLNANLSGGSRLFYLGNPTLGVITTSGGSTVAAK
jgi:Putative auto-transporter adhesin, head GIN domain